jgi:hypothetical protein
MNERLKLGRRKEPASVDFWVIESRLNLGTFRKLQGVFDVDTEISNGALNLRMTDQDLDGSQIARRLVNDRGFGIPERVRSVFPRLKSDASDPFVDQPSILPRAHFASIVVTAWKDVVVG